ncbi:MAG: ATP-binding cassette domain-containing protein, partial [Longicatena sp.]
MLKLVDIKKTYIAGNTKVDALKGINLQFRKKEFVAILGASGCGKTTLLNLIGGLDHYTSGNLIIDNVSTKDYKDKDWDAYRNNCVGFIFQSYNLIGHINVLTNVEMSMTLSGYSHGERKKKALEALDRV